MANTHDRDNARNLKRIADGVDDLVREAKKRNKTKEYKLAGVNVFGNKTNPQDLPIHKAALYATRDEGKFRIASPSCGEIDSFGAVVTEFDDLVTCKECRKLHQL